MRGAGLDSNPFTLGPSGAAYLIPDFAESFPQLMQSRPYWCRDIDSKLPTFSTPIDKAIVTDGRNRGLVNRNDREKYEIAITREILTSRGRGAYWRKRKSMEIEGL